MGPRSRSLVWERPGDLIEALKPSVDGFVVNYGVARACRDELAETGLCLRTDIYKPDMPQGSVKLVGGEEAREVGACAMMHMLYPGHADEARIVRECSDTIREGIRPNVPVIVEALPVGLGMASAYTIDANWLQPCGKPRNQGPPWSRRPFPVGATAGGVSAQWSQVVSVQ